MQTTKAELSEKIIGLLPPNCVLEKLETEGPDIVLYIDDLDKFYSSPNPVKDIATGIKKKIIIRGTKDKLLPPDEAAEKIKNLVQEDAGISNIQFSPDFSEVWIEAYKPGLVIGKGGSTLKELIKSTGWAPKILRRPTIPSPIIQGIRGTLFKESNARKKFLNKIGSKIFSTYEKTDWVKINALGAFREVGRSCIYLETSNDKIILDSGLRFEATDTSKEYPYISTINVPIDEIDALVLSHAHLDHCGFIPYYFAMGYEGPIYCTPPSRDLMALLCFDYIKVMKRQGLEPLYEEKDVRKAIVHSVTREYGEVTDISPEIKLTFHNAGHILGSSLVHLHISEGLHNFVYTGDMKYSQSKLFNAASTVFPRVETLLMESTYGGRNDAHLPLIDAEQKLGRVVMETIKNGGKVLIPVFSVGRSQEMMIIMDELTRRHSDFNPKVYIDGMVLAASAIHTVYPEYLRDGLQRQILSNRSPFESPIFEVVKHNRDEIIEGGPSVILAPSGMMTGGPSVEYFKRLAHDPKNCIIFVGFNTNYSLGRKIQRGDKEVPIVGEDGRLQTIKINMRVETAEGFSGHSDRKRLIAFARNVRPKPTRILTLHGEAKKCEDLARTLSKILHVEGRAPHNLDAIRLE